MIKWILKGFICITFFLGLCGCTSHSNQFYITSDYDYFKDAGDMGFYKKGVFYGFIRLNGDTTELKPFTLDEELSETINLESIKCTNGLATFSTNPVYEGSIQQHGFMDLKGNVLLNEDWGTISPFNRSGYTSVNDKRLNKYVIINKEGKTVRDSQSYIECYYPNPDIFICRDTFDTNHSNTNYYVLDKDLHLLLDDLEVYYETPASFAHTRQYTIFGDSEKFIYKKHNKYYIYQIKSNKTIAEFDNYENLLADQKEFVEECQKTYVNKYEHSVMTESYNDVYIHYDEDKDTYLLTDEDGQTIFKPDPDITGLTYHKGKVIQGINKSTGKTVVIFNRDFK